MHDKVTRVFSASIYYGIVKYINPALTLDTIGREEYLFVFISTTCVFVFKFYN